MRLIDADAANVDNISCYYGSSCYAEDVEEWLNEQPTIDAEPVKHGRLLRFEHDENWSVCSECKCCWEREIIASCNIN